MEINIKKVLESSEKRLRREIPGAVATGIGVFVIVYRDDLEILVRTRTETGSLYGEDLSKKKELPGGAVDIADFEKEYDSAPVIAGARELFEETGLILHLEKLAKPVLLKPAWAIIGEGIIDLAFAIDVPFFAIEETPLYKELLNEKKLEWVHVSELEKVEFISKRMAFLAKHLT